MNITLSQVTRGKGKRERGTWSSGQEAQRASGVKMAGLYGRAAGGRGRTAQLLGWRVQRAEYASQEDPVIGGD